MHASELRADVHSVEPIPDADRDSTGPQQMWIWAGANIAPINWALGALGIILKLGLWETISVIVIGNIIGCAIFAAFTVMGHKTGVNQMVLSRSAFGRRGAYLPSTLMFLMTLGWIGVNTYFPVKIAMAILGQFGVPDNWVNEIIVITVVMVLQVGIGIYGFYAIRTFEKYTVPVTAAIMVLMSALAWSQPGLVNWNLTTTLEPGAHLAMLSLLMTAIGVGWGISWVTWASDYSRFVSRSVPSYSVYWYSYIGMFVPTVWLAILGATIASVTQDTDPAKMVSAVFGGGSRHPRPADGSARTHRDQHSECLFGGACGAQHRAPFVSHRASDHCRHRRLSRHNLLYLRTVFRESLRQLDDRSAALDESLGRRHFGRLLYQAGERDRR
jgi:purine-cytosine permease-like protein